MTIFVLNKDGKPMMPTTRPGIQPNDRVKFNGSIYKVKGCQHYGEYVALDNGKSVSVKSVIPVGHAGGWAVLRQG